MLKRLKNGIVVLAMMSAVSACASTSVQPILNECLWTELITPTDSDIDTMSDALVEQILNHNDKYTSNC